MTRQPCSLHLDELKVNIRAQVGTAIWHHDAMWQTDWDLRQSWTNEVLGCLTKGSISRLVLDDFVGSTIGTAAILRTSSKPGGDLDRVNALLDQLQRLVKQRQARHTPGGSVISSSCDLDARQATAGDCPNPSTLGCGTRRLVMISPSCRIKILSSPAANDVLMMEATSLAAKMCDLVASNPCFLVFLPGL